MDGQTVREMNGWMEKYTGRFIEKEKDGQIDNVKFGWMDKSTNKRTGKQMHRQKVWTVEMKAKSIVFHKKNLGIPMDSLRRFPFPPTDCRLS